MYIELFNLVENISIIDIYTRIFSLSIDIPSCLRFKERKRIKSVVKTAILNNFNITLENNKVISTKDCSIHFKDSSISFIFNEDKCLDKVINTIKYICQNANNLYIMTNEKEKTILDKYLSNYKIRYF